MDDVLDIPEMDPDTIKTGKTIGDILNKIDIANNMSDAEYIQMLRTKIELLQRENYIMQQYILAKYFEDIDDCDEEVHDYD